MAGWQASISRQIHSLKSQLSCQLLKAQLCFWGRCPYACCLTVRHC